MLSFFTRRATYICPALFGVGILFAVPAHASAATRFFIDSSYDDVARTQISATHLLDGNHAHFYVEDSFLDSLSAPGKQQLSDYAQKISDDFDDNIYPSETYVFGNEWKPGIDNDLKITVLITPMRNSAGGYLRPEDEQPVSQVAESNQREILYLNARLVQYPHIHEFLAHEFQHLINYNQKSRLKGFEEEVWLNEMMSEVAPLIAGIPKEATFSYEKSNIRDRVTTFLASPNDDLLDWNEAVQDYGSVALLGYYLYEHYGAQLFTDLEQSDETGVVALDQALQDVGAQKTFEQVVSDWMIATILNDCNAAPSTSSGQAPQNVYCYTDSFLNYDNLHIQFHRTQIGDSEVSFQQQTDEWAGNWFRYVQNSSQGSAQDLQSSPAGTYLNFSFSTLAYPTELLGSYIVYNADGSVRVYPLNFSKSASRLASSGADWFVPDFGTSVKQVDVVFGDFSHKQMTRNNPFTLAYNLDATLSSKPEGKQPSMAITNASLLNDGDLIRATGDSKVYVVNGNYKRWIQTAAIFNSYGNLQWDQIQEVSPGVLAGYRDSPLVRLAGDPRVFREDANGTKHWITTEKAFLHNGYNFGMIFTINQNEFNAFRTGKAITF